jgi:ribose 5-phosphate isomerase B
MPNPLGANPRIAVRVGLAADHGGFELKRELIRRLLDAGHVVADFGNLLPDPLDDYPDFVIPLAHAVAAGKVDRGLAVCGSGVGATIAVNKIPGVRGCLVMDPFSAHQGVEDDAMNVLCLGGRTIGPELAWELVKAFLAAEVSGEERHQRRQAKVAALER